MYTKLYDDYDEKVIKAHQNLIKIYYEFDLTKTAFKSYKDTQKLYIKNCGL